MGWIDAVLGLLGVISLATFGFAIRLALCAKAAAAKVERQLGAYKVEVAEKYATIGYLKDVENRIANHLRSIEEKLDRWIEGPRSER
jgi:hypothetical protein